MSGTPTSFIVLHGHLPYVHEPDHASFLEEDWYFEALLETYLPLLGALDRIAERGLSAKFAIGLTPPLLEMLRAKALCQKADSYLLRRRELAEEEVRRIGAIGNAPTLPAAKHYLERFQSAHEIWQRSGGDLVQAFKEHADAGRIELIASAATHAILPNLATDEGLAAQIAIGCQLYEEVFGQKALGFWLPECAYRKGIEVKLFEAGIRWVVLETHAIQTAEERPPHGVHRPLMLPGGVLALGRDPVSSRQVWAKEVGYPGDPEYRERYRDLGFDGAYDHIRRWLHGDGVRRDLGIKYHRVTGSTVPLDQKDFWHPDRAYARASEHARHFLSEREREGLQRKPHLTGRPICTSPYDLELFGHWWYEGPWFLEELATLAEDRRDRIVLDTPKTLLEADEPLFEAQPGVSTWGKDGFMKVWLNPRNSWILRHQQELEHRMVGHAQNYTEPTATERRLLNQMARELLLAQASDWAFIITHETAEHYARLRVHEHVARYLALERKLLGQAELADDVVSEWERRDALFPGLSYRVFAGQTATLPGERLGTAPTPLDEA